MSNQHPPAPESLVEIQRVEHTRLRRRIIYGRHEQDVEAEILRSIGSIRKAAWGSPDMTSNPMNVVYSQLAALYTMNPLVSPPDGAEMAAAEMAAQGYWTMMQRVQRDTLALRTMAVRVDMIDVNGVLEPRFRSVFPDMMEVETTPDSISVPYLVKEWISDSALGWVQLQVDTRNGGSYKAFNSDGENITSQYLGDDMSGDNYPWLVNGIPKMPYVFYRAANTSWLWDAFTDKEVVSGSLRTALLLTYYGHVMRNSAWAQRYAIGAVPAGAVTESGQAEVITDPSTLLILKQDEDFAGQATVGQWNSPANPKSILESIMQYEQRIVETAIGYASASRTSSDIRSGYSLAVSREQQRDSQKRYEPLFRESDIRMSELVAGLMSLKEGSWSIRYRSIPKDPTSLKSEWDNIESLIAAGMMSRRQGFYILNPELTQEEADTLFNKVQEENAADKFLQDKAAQ